MKKESGRRVANTLIGYKTTFEGTIEFEGIVRIDGTVTGSIQSRGGTLIIGEKAKVNASIVSSNVVVRGEVTGSIVASGKIEVYPPGIINGDVQAAVVSIETGVLFNGTCAIKPRTISSAKFANFSGKSTNSVVVSR